MSLKSEIIRIIEVLQPTDSDLRSITICLNPNYINGADRDLKLKIQSILNDLIKDNIISNTIKDLQIYDNNHKSNKKLTLFKIKKTNKRLN